MQFGFVDSQSRLQFTPRVDDQLSRYEPDGNSIGVSSTRCWDDGMGEGASHPT